MSDAQNVSSVPMTADGTTQYGFRWGPMLVERMAHIDGRGYVVSIRSTELHTGPEVQVYVSEKGRSVKAFPLRGAKSGR